MSVLLPSRAIRWGVLGTAAIGVTRTIPAMLLAPSAKVVAIASRDEVRARQAARSLGVPRVHADYEALLADAEIDAVYLPLPNQLHREWAIKAMEAGKHVLCEKPLALSAIDVRELQGSRDRTGRHIEEAFVFRNHPQWECLRQLIKEDTIGRVCGMQAVMARQILDPSDPRNDPAPGGGALYALGCDVTAAFGEVMQRAPVRVLAAMERDPVFGTDRLSTALFDYGDAQATFTVSTQAGSDAWDSHQGLTILGSKGWLRCDFPFAQARPTVCHVFVGDSSSVGMIASSAITFEPVNQYERQIERFSRLLLGEPTDSWPIEGALQTLQIMEGLFASAETGSWQHLDRFVS